MATGGTMFFQEVQLVRGVDKRNHWFKDPDLVVLNNCIESLQRLAAVGRMYDDVRVLGTQPPPNVDALPANLDLVRWLTEGRVVIRKAPIPATTDGPAPVDVPTIASKPAKAALPEILTPGQVAGILGIPIARVHNLVDSGRLPTTNGAGRAVATDKALIRRADVEAYRTKLK